MSWIVWLYAAGGAAFASCALLYGLRSPWYRSPMGWALFASWTSLALVLILASLFRFLHLPHSLALVLAGILLSLVDVTGLVLLVTVLRLQRRDLTTKQRNRR